MFRIGQKIICINDAIGSFQNAKPRRFISSISWINNLDGLQAGRIYTVRDVLPDPDFDVELVRLCEIYRGSNFSSGIEAGFAAARFRPLVERKTDISIFQAMLTPSPVTVDAMKLADHAREIVG